MTSKPHSLLLPSDLVISVFSSGDQATFADERRLHPDSIELYNQGNQPAILNECLLTDARRDQRKWYFTGGNFNGGERIVVFASGENKLNKAHRCYHVFVYP